MSKEQSKNFYLILTGIQTIIGLINDESFRFWLLHYLFFTIVFAIVVVISYENN